MSVSYWFAPTELTRGKRWINRWWPSRRLRMDPLRELRIDERYAPVSIANWKLIPAVAQAVLARRVTRPLSFSAGRKLTVVIPYRDRAHHLQQLLPELTSRLREQDIAYRIVVVEQEPGALFNRGRLLNIGMHYSADATDYYCLHDVDAVPLVANYLCPSQPVRLANRVLGPNGEAQYSDYYFSGAICLRREQAFAVNGFSNEYWGWGKEDDDFFFRLLRAGFLCYFDLNGLFRDLPNPHHQQVQRKPVTPPHVKRNRRRRSQLLRGLLDPADDGLANIQYRIIERVDHPAYEHIRVRW